MINNLALDTNVWFSFIEKVEFDLLDRLSEGIKSGRLKIILPEFVEFEFNKKLDNIISNTLKKNEKVSQHDLDSITGIILNIFKLSIKLKTNEIGITEWIRKGKAPNHNSNNYEDTVILNTLLTLKKGVVFHLVTNDSDYRISKTDYRIHPDIVDKFNKKGLKINLSTDFSKTIYGFGLAQTRINKLSTYELYNWKVFRLQVKDKSIFIQLQEAIKYYYKELDFIPLSYLSNIFPLKSNNNSQTYFRGATLMTDNKKMFDFFDNSLIKHKTRGVKIKKSSFKSDEEIFEFKKILEKLNGNLVHTLGYKRKQISIYIKEKKPLDVCSCVECTLNRHAVQELNLKIKNENLDNNPKNLLKKAFYFFKLKDYLKALKTIDEILSTVKRSDYEIIYSIAQENKVILEKIWLYGSDNFEEERKKIKLQNENEILKQGISSIIGYLKYSKFFDYKFYSLNEDIEKVRKRYDIHNGLGSSHISDIDWKNVIRWAEVTNIMSENGLFFDYYSNINGFAKTTFTQDVISSKDRTVQSYLSDYIFTTTLPYLKIEDYKKVFFEFGVKKLHINKKQIQDIYILFNSIINNFSQISELEEKHPYYEYYFNQIKKIAFLIGYIDFSKLKTNDLISKIFNLYPNNVRDGKEVLFDSLIQNRIKGINRKNALMYIESFYKKEIDYSFNVNNIFNLLEHFKTIKLTSNQLEILFVDDIEDRSGYYRFYVLYRLHSLGNKTIKKRVLGIVSQELNNEVTFNYKMYNLFVREKIIPNSKKHYKTFLKGVVNDFNRESQVNYSNQTNREIKDLKRLNEFINHVYEHYNDPYNHLKQFLGRSDYYDFLINPNSIEIDEFDIHWFYVACKKSYIAIRKIMINNKILSIISNKILESNNNKYYQAYVDVMAHINE